MLHWYLTLKYFRTPLQGSPNILFSAGMEHFWFPLHNLVASDVDFGDAQSFDWIIFVNFANCGNLHVLRSPLSLPYFTERILISFEAGQEICNVWGEQIKSVDESAIKN